MQRPEVWVVGEALIDLLPSGDASVPVVGGGPANTAKALANLGIYTAFIGGISSDEYGAIIVKELASLDLSKTIKSNLPTALAIVSLNQSGSPSYEFKVYDTATFDFKEVSLPTGKPDLLFVGSLAALIEPGASELFKWAVGIGAPIIFDPNVRPSILGKRDIYRNSVERWIAVSEVVKMSDEDFNWLGYSSPKEIIDFGPKLLVVTHGKLGLTGYTNSGSIFVPGFDVEVVDTVGAGDTVGAVIAEGLITHGLALLLKDKLYDVLSRANKAASITCSRAGAYPPSLAELSESKANEK